MAQATFDLLESVSSFVKDEIRRSSIGSTPRLGTIDPEYIPSTYPNELPRVTFDGESTMSDKRYTVASTYHPYPTDRVVLVPVNGSYVIMNSLSPGAKVFSDGLSLSNPDFEVMNPGNEDTTSTTFTDLTTFGPSCSVETGSRAIVILTARVSSTNAPVRGVMGYDISGATTLAAGVSRSLRITGNSNGLAGFNRQSAFHLEEGLTPGVNNFVAKYLVEGAGTARFDARSLFVWPL